MSDLEEIAAAAGITIIDTPSDGGDADSTPSGLQELNGATTAPVLPGALGDRVVSPPEEELEVMFPLRYTMEDPDYAKLVSEADKASHPPCVQDFHPRRPRYDRSGGRGRGHYNQHQDQRSSYGDRRGDDRRGWGGGGRDYSRDRDWSSSQGRDRLWDRRGGDRY